MVKVAVPAAASGPVRNSNKKTNKINKKPKTSVSHKSVTSTIRKKKEKVKEINYEEEFLKHNYLFLVNTIKQMSNKLYINWFDVIPYNMVDYMNEKLLYRIFFYQD